MKIYDISQEVFSCCVYPGDPKPEKKTLCATADGAMYNLTAFSMCAHNGTHIDAPFHFLHDGKTVEQLPLETFVGDLFLQNTKLYINQNALKKSTRFLLVYLELALKFLNVPESPNKEISNEHCRQSERHADFKEVGVFNIVAVLP